MDADVSLVQPLLDEPPRRCDRWCWVLLAVFCAVMLDLWKMRGLAFTRRGYHLQNRHLVNDGNFTDWLPIDGCLMPPPLPFYVDCSQSVAQSSVVSLLFGAVDITAGQVHARFLDWAITWGIGVFQVSMFFITMVLTLQHFYNEHVGASSTWDRFSCFGCLLTEGPWALTVMTAPAQYLITSHLMRLSREWCGRITDPDAWTKGKGSVTERKVVLLRVLATAIVFVFGGQYFPFVVTHSAPGFVVFSPVTIPMVALGYIISRYLGAFDKWQRIQMPGLAGAELAEEKDEASTQLLVAVQEKQQVEAFQAQANDDVEKAKFEQTTAREAQKKAASNAETARREASHAEAAYAAAVRVEATSVAAASEASALAKAARQVGTHHQSSRRDKAAASASAAEAAVTANVASKDAKAAARSARREGENAEAAANHAQQAAEEAKRRVAEAARRIEEAYFMTVKAKEAQEKAITKEAEARQAEERAILAIREAHDKAKIFQFLLLELLPFLMSIKVAFKISFFGMLNLYEGMDWGDAMFEVLAVRQVGVWISNLKEKVLSQLWQMAWLVDAST